MENTKPSTDRSDSEGQLDKRVIFFCDNCKEKLKLIDDPNEKPVNNSIHQNTMIGYKIFYCEKCNITYNTILNENNRWIKF